MLRMSQCVRIQSPFFNNIPHSCLQPKQTKQSMGFMRPLALFLKPMSSDTKKMHLLILPKDLLLQCK